MAGFFFLKMALPCRRWWCRSSRGCWGWLCCSWGWSRGGWCRGRYSTCHSYFVLDHGAVVVMVVMMMPMVPKIKQKTVNLAFLKAIFILKVSWFQKQIVKPWILPKTNRWIRFYYYATCFCSFLEKIEDSKKAFQNLTFRLFLQGPCCWWCLNILNIKK